MSRRRRLLCLSALAALWLGALGAALPQRIYVWQRTWTPDLRNAVSAQAGNFSALDVLAAEIIWTPAGPDVRRVKPDWSALRAAGRPVGLVVRIGPATGTWKPDSPATQTVVATCREALAAARAASAETAELQLDFDAATRRLADYRELLAVVRREVRPPRLVITVLPDWLHSPDFPDLIRATDCYVLQVHSLEKPRTLAETYTLCDPARAAAWVAQAAALQHPFRIALPTYGYRLIFDAAGNFAALEAEGPAGAWPAGYQSRVVMADHGALALWVQGLLANPPPASEALVWFRFPTTDDELAWGWPTLRAVMQGTPPAPSLTVLAQPNDTGALDLSVTNLGTAGAEPGAFRVEWHEALLLAADPLGGWQFARMGPHAMLVRPPPYRSTGPLRPGESMRVGWMRLSQPVSLTITPVE